MAIFLWNNKKLETLEMRQCFLDDQASEALADGLARNSTLRHLDISQNRIEQHSMHRWEEVLGRSPLKYLDISCNNLHDEGAMCVIRGLIQGWTVSQVDVKLAPAHKQWVASMRMLPKLRHLIMRNVEMGDQAGILLSQLIAANQKLQRIAIEGNTINFKYVEEVNAACARNRQLHKRKVVPKYQQALGTLISSTQPFGVKITDPSAVPMAMLRQRECYQEELKHLAHQHTRKA